MYIEYEKECCKNWTTGKTKTQELGRKKTHQWIEQLANVNINSANIEANPNWRRKTRTSTDIRKWFRISANGSIFSLYLSFSVYLGGKYTLQYTVARWHQCLVKNWFTKNTVEMYNIQCMPNKSAKTQSNADIEREQGADKAGSERIRTDTEEKRPVQNKLTTEELWLLL